MQPDHKTDTIQSRRRFLLGSLGVAAFASLPSAAQAATQITTLWEEGAEQLNLDQQSSRIYQHFRNQSFEPQSGEKFLQIYSRRTGEKLRTVYWADGEYIDEALRDLNLVLRDFRTDEVHPIDIDLIDSLHALQSRLGAQKQEVHIISAYRSPKTNEMLRRSGHGVAKNSYHTKGQAIDICLPSCELKQVHNAALAMKNGGVGYYPRSGFVHIDVGPVRTWG